MVMGAVLVFFSIYFYVVGLSPATIKNDGGSIVKAYIPCEVTVPLEDRIVTFAIAGDVMLDRNVWHNFKDKELTDIFDNFDVSIFKDKDIALFNLEGPISREPIDDDWQSGSMIFNFPPESIDVLKLLGIDAVSLANNHTQNAGSSGLAMTKEMLDETEVEYFGKQTGFNWDNVLRLDTIVPITLIGVDALADFDKGAMLSAIRLERADKQFVIIMPHWGTEYAESHSAAQENLARSWIDAGAGLILGGHPHVVQDFEVIDNVPVIYSMGNFVFDQMFSEETQEGLIVTGEITPEKLTLNFIPTKQQKIYVREMTDTEASNLISNTLKSDSNTIEISR